MNRTAGAVGPAWAATAVVETPAPRIAPPPRDILIDVVRGFAIILVALGHTNLGVLHRGWWGASATGLRLSAAIYSFHMPAFFFVSGVFLRAGVDKRGEKRYTLEKLRTMIYPYALWATIFALATIPFARFMMQPTPSWGTFFFNLVTADTFWFLPTLFFAIMIGMLARRVPMPLLFALSAAVCMFLPHTNVQFEDRGVRHLPFLVAGMWVGNSFTLMQRVPSLAAALIAALCGAAIVFLTGQPYAESGYLFIPLGLLGTLMLMLVAKCLGNSRAASALAWTGAASFGIFLMSSFPQGAGREFVLRALRTTAPWPQLIFPTLLAVLIPAWFYHRRVRLRISWLFIWPF
ncbi:MAG: acyltransferase [Acidobacteriaceae bacterium]